jgi:hypothetical protein
MAKAAKAAKANSTKGPKSGMTAKTTKAAKTTTTAKTAKTAKAAKTTKTTDAAKVRPWTKDDIRSLKTLAREKAKTSDIAKKLKRTIGATYQKAMRLGVTLKGNRTTRA